MELLLVSQTWLVRFENSQRRLTHNQFGMTVRLTRPFLYVKKKTEQHKKRPLIYITDGIIGSFPSLALPESAAFSGIMPTNGATLQRTNFFPLWRKLLLSRAYTSGLQKTSALANHEAERDRIGLRS